MLSNNKCIRVVIGLLITISLSFLTIGSSLAMLVPGEFGRGRYYMPPSLPGEDWSIPTSERNSDPEPQEEAPLPEPTSLEITISGNDVLTDVGISATEPIGGITVNEFHGQKSIDTFPVIENFFDATEEMFAEIDNDLGLSAWVKENSEVLGVAAAAPIIAALAIEAPIVLLGVTVGALLTACGGTVPEEPVSSPIIETETRTTSATQPKEAETRPTEVPVLASFSGVDTQEIANWLEGNRTTVDEGGAVIKVNDFRVGHQILKNWNPNTDGMPTGKEYTAANGWASQDFANGTWQVEKDTWKPNWIPGEGPKSSGTTIKDILITELGYNESTAQDVAQRLSTWTEIADWQDKLSAARQEYEQGEKSIEDLSKIELDIVKELGHKIKNEIPTSDRDRTSEIDVSGLGSVIETGEANCLGYTQLVFVLGTTVGLSVEATQVAQKYLVEMGAHIICIVNLSDERQVMVDLSSSSDNKPIFISEPFVIDNEFEQVDNYLEIEDTANPLNLFTRIRPLDENGLLARLKSDKGSKYHKSGEYDLSISEFTTAIALDPKCSIAYVGRGNAYAMLGDLRRQEEDYDQAADYYNKAIADHTKAIELNPKEAVLYFNRGNVYFSGKEDYNQAISDFTKAIELNPEEAMLYNTRGLVYAFSREYDQALVDFNKVVELEPNEAIAYRNRGVVYYYLEKYDQALVDFNTTIELDPSDAYAYLSRGNVYMAIGEQEKADQDFAKAEELD